MSCFCLLLEDGTPLLLEDGSGCVLLEDELKSSYGIALDQLRQMLAESATFQAAVGGTEAAVKSRVHFGRQTGSPPRPFALIELEAGDGEGHGYGAGNQFFSAGSALVRFERDAVLSDPDPYSEALDWFANVVDEVNALAGSGDDETLYDQTHLSLLGVSLTNFGANQRSTWHSLNQFYTARMLWNWGG